MDLQASTDHLGPLFHADQPIVLAPGRKGLVGVESKPIAVVPYFQLDVVGRCTYGNHHRPGVGMPDHVGQRLLRDPVHGCLDVGLQPLREVALESALHPGRSLYPLHVVTERRLETALAESGGMELDHHVAKIIDAALHPALDPFDEPDELRVIRTNAIAKHLQPDVQRGQLLDRPVVDPAASRFRSCSPAWTVRSSRTWARSFSANNASSVILRSIA